MKKALAFLNKNYISNFFICALVFLSLANQYELFFFLFKIIFVLALIKILIYGNLKKSLKMFFCISPFIWASFIGLLKGYDIFSFFIVYCLGYLMILTILTQFPFTDSEMLIKTIFFIGAFHILSFFQLFIDDLNLIKIPFSYYENYVNGNLVWRSNQLTSLLYCTTILLFNGLYDKKILYLLTGLACWFLGVSIDSYILIIGLPIFFMMYFFFFLLFKKKYLWLILFSSILSFFLISIEISTPEKIITGNLIRQQIIFELLNQGPQNLLFGAGFGFPLLNDLRLQNKPYDNECLTLYLIISVGFIFSTFLCLWILFSFKKLNYKKAFLHSERSLIFASAFLIVAGLTNPYFNSIEQLYILSLPYCFLVKNTSFEINTKRCTK